MPTIKESDLEVEFEYCFKCGVNEGSQYLCGEGWICSSCFSEESGIDEADLILNDEVDQATKDLVRHNIREDRGELDES